MKRKQQRDLLAKSVFAHFFQKETSIEEIFNSVLNNFPNEKLTESEKSKYIDPMLQHFKTEEGDAQSLISRHLKSSWKIERIPKLDLAILEVAVQEIKHLSDIPFDVSVNEAVDLAKLYSTEKSPSFVNGILVGIYEEVN